MPEAKDGMARRGAVGEGGGPQSMAEAMAMAAAGAMRVVFMRRSA
jgi:hypothetical protein